MYHSRFRPNLLVAALLLATVTEAQSVEVVSVSYEQYLPPEGVDEFIAPLFEEYQSPAAAYGVDIYLMMIRVEHPSGVPTDVRVQLLLPQTGSDPARGLYLFAAGSTGLINPCRSSREHEAGIRWGLYRAHTLAYSGQGFIGVLPDYMGFEDWNLLQPYFHAESEARVIQGAIAGLDQWLTGGVGTAAATPPVLATRVRGENGVGDGAPDAGGPSGSTADGADEAEATGDVGTVAFVPGEFTTTAVSGVSGLTRVAAGYSQGGHAIFAAADRNAGQPERLRLDAVIGHGPTTEIESVFLEYSQVAPMVVQAFASIYGEDAFDPFRILRSDWAETLAYDTSRQCVGGIQSYYPAELEELYDPDFLASLTAGTLPETHPQISRILQENRTGLTPHRVPALICQGTDDIVIDRWTQDDVVIEMREIGNFVKYYVYQGSRHDTRQIAFSDVMEWIDALGEDES